MLTSEAPVQGAACSSPCHFCKNNNIFFQCRPLLSSISERPLPIMWGDGANIISAVVVNRGKNTDI